MEKSYFMLGFTCLKRLVNSEKIFSFSKKKLDQRL